MTVTSDAPPTLGLGQMFVLNVTLTPTSDVTGLRSHVTSDPELRIDVNDGTEVVIGDVSAGQSQTRTVEITTLEEGRHYINIFFKGTFGSSQMGGVKSIAIQVGETPKKSKKAIHYKTDAKGQKIIERRAISP
jgi:hypothetical protein